MIKSQKVKLLLNTKVDKVVSKGSKIEKVILDNKKEILCDSVISATGGLSYPLTGSTGDGYKFAKSLGHSIVDTKPSLIGIEVQESFVKNLEKLSLRNIEISVYNSKNKKIKKPAPASPNSSQMIEKIMSFCASGTNPSFWIPLPSPLPNSPPEPIAYSPYTV